MPVGAFASDADSSDMFFLQVARLREYRGSGVMAY
jgi:hypothetical protein